MKVSDITSFIISFEIQYGICRVYTQCRKRIAIILSQVKVKGKVIPLQAGVAQRVGRGIALLFHDRGTRRG